MLLEKTANRMPYEHGVIDNERSLLLRSCLPHLGEINKGE